MENALNLNNSSMEIDPEYEKEVSDAMIHFWIPKTSENPDRFQWYTSWEIVLASINTTIGGIGFTGYPDESGETEVGFMIDKPQQRKGYALEALAAMIEWAMLDQNTGSILARTPLDNAASQNLLLKAGFIGAGNANDLMNFRLTRSSRITSKV